MSVTSTDGGTDETLPADTEMVVVAFGVRSGHVYVHVGPNKSQYPLRFDAVRSDDKDTLVIKSDMDRIRREALGFLRFATAPVDAEGGQELLRLVKDLRESDETLLEVLRTHRYLLGITGVDIDDETRNIFEDADEDGGSA